MNLETGKATRMEQLDGRMNGIEVQLGESNEQVAKRVRELKDQVTLQTKFRSPSLPVRLRRTNKPASKPSSSRTKTSPA